MVGVSRALVGGGEEDERFRAPAEPGPVRGPRLPATFAVALPRCPVRGSVPRMDGSVVSLLNSVLEGELRRGTLLVDGIVSWGTAPLPVTVPGCLSTGGGATPTVVWSDDGF